MAELWFDSVEAMTGGVPDPEAAARAAAELLEDERNFIDLPNSPIWLGNEHAIVG